MPKMIRRAVLPSYEADLVGRVIFTFLAAAIGQLIVTWQGWDKWWSLAIAAGFTAVRAAFDTLSNEPGDVLSANFWERVGWTAAQLALATIVVSDMHGIPLTYAPIVAAALAALKSYVAAHVGAPTAAVLPARIDRSPRVIEGEVVTRARE